MALIRRRVKATEGIPTASMADIAFLLLIFFLTTTVFDEDIGLQVVLPDPGPEAATDIPVSNMLFFLIQPDGTLQIRRGSSSTTQPATARQVEPIMRQELVRNPNVVAVIQTSPEAAYQDMINVLDGIRSAGATRYSIQLMD
ncbi:MAG TPA: biopolymer transporter ExbD [Longimicrobiaceae bacterium]